MYELIYISQSVRYFSKAELEELAEKARTKNNNKEITGMLLYIDGEFMQLLEGPRTKVRGLMRYIEKDSRHHSIRIIKENPIKERQFKDWNMASQMVTGSYLNYFLPKKLDYPVNLPNIFCDETDMAKQLFMKVRDHFLVPANYSYR